jgi:murein endopeptidase
MLEVQPKDSRGYFMLPQAPEDAGYYVYGNVGRKPHTGHLAQFAHPSLLSLIFYIEREWEAIDDRKFGIGNISIAGGLPYDKHKSHQKGIEMDIRPVRKDKLVGQSARVSRFDAVYDREATIKLIRLFVQHPLVKIVYFNDDKVQQAIGGHVRSLKGHDDHFHVEIWEGR